MKQEFGKITPDMVYDYHRRMDQMKNHTGECPVVTTGDCTCPAPDRVSQLERECDTYLDKIANLYAENAELKDDNQALAEYPWGQQWTYWFVAMIAGGAAMVGLIVGSWLFQ